MKKDTDRKNSTEPYNLLDGFGGIVSVWEVRLVEHHAKRLRSIVAILVWFILLCPMAIRAGSKPMIDYLYIEAGEGDSSGGHVAIGFGEDVFHYQYARGLLKAVRQNRKEFEYQYRFLGNRTIHISRIEVPEAAYDKLRDYFIRKYLVQSRQFKGLELIGNDIGLLEKLHRAASHIDSLSDFHYPIKGAALFLRPNRTLHATRTSSTSNSPVFLQEVMQKYGPLFISNRKAEIRRSLAALRETRWNTGSLAVSADRYPTLPYSLAERFSDLLTKQLALEVIQYGVSLNPDLRIDADSPAFDLDPRQLEMLGRYRSDLQQDLLKLLASSRPDWGYPMLVGLARLQVLDESLQHGKLIFLSTFRADSEPVDPEDLRRYRVAFETLFAEARGHFESEKERFFALSKMNESGYAQLEMFANRFVELAHGIAGKPMRIHDGDLAPQAIADVRVSVIPEINAVTLSNESKRLQEYETEYSDLLEEQYRYHLLTRNCVSEIFGDIEQALSARLEGDGYPDSNEIETLLRPEGSIDHALWNAIPFVSSLTLRENFNVGDSEALLSYRQALLKELYVTDNPLATYFRESNILTSTLYPWNPDDGLFVFFTDDAVLPRPIFGAFNVIAGVGQTLVGGFISPLSGGDVFFQGLKGFLSSLPELVFFNIRKGSYRYQPFDRFMDREAGAF